MAAHIALDEGATFYDTSSRNLTLLNCCINCKLLRGDFFLPHCYQVVSDAIHQHFVYRFTTKKLRVIKKHSVDQSTADT